MMVAPIRTLSLYTPDVEHWYSHVCVPSWWSCTVASTRPGPTRPTPHGVPSSRSMAPEALRAIITNVVARDTMAVRRPGPATHEVMHDTSDGDTPSTDCTSDHRSRYRSSGGAGFAALRAPLRDNMWLQKHKIPMWDPDVSVNKGCLG